MNKLRIGVIGVGHLGAHHVKILSELTSVELAGVYDPDKDRAAFISGEVKTRNYASVDEMLRDVQCVSIVAPTSKHFDVAWEAIKREVHVFIEKPITSTTEEAQSLVQLAKQKNVKIQVGHIERFNPAILALDKYDLRPMFVESHRLAQFNPRGSDVAVVLDLMIHDIDIIMSLVRSPVAKIDANGIAVVSDNVDIANARIQFENGCVANVTASRISQKKMRKMRMFQQDAYISVDFLDGVAEVFRLLDENDESAKATMMLGAIERGSQKRNIVYEQPEIKEVNALKYELELFIDAVQNGTEPVVGGEDGLRALTVAQEIMQIIQQQKLSI
ncbi:MAG TPA: Gfo/Idh/MocA family oxidoreductase [Bacteroidota bacterium]|nr:Gfo/Idh/MocA family oxidoreductase [Bacteroidota bacterium]